MCSVLMHRHAMVDGGTHIWFDVKAICAMLGHYRKVESGPV